MRRLVEKKILIRKKDGRSYLYEAKDSKEKFVESVTHCTIKNLVSKFGDLATEALKKELA